MTYVRNNDFVIELTFTNPGFPTRNVTLSVIQVQLMIPDPNPLEDPVIIELDDDGPYSMTITGQGGTDTATMTLSGVPDYVTRGYLQIELEAKEGQSTIWSTDGLETWQKVFLTLDTPCGHMDEPWADVLDQATNWALSADSVSEAATGCTVGLFDASQFICNLHETGIPSKCFDWQEDEEDEEYDEKFLLTYVVTHTNIEANCVDVSTYNSICMNALGVSASLSRQFGSASFATNLVCPIGSDRTADGNYELVPFGMHQQVHLTGDKVYDAALSFKYDLSGSTSKSPAVNEDLGPPGYWQTPEGPSPLPQYGLARRYINLTYDEIEIDGETWTWSLNSGLSHQVVTFSSSPFTYPGVK